MGAMQVGQIMVDQPERLAEAFIRAGVKHGEMATIQVAPVNVGEDYIAFCPTYNQPVFLLKKDDQGDGPIDPRQKVSFADLTLPAPGSHIATITGFSNGMLNIEKIEFAPLEASQI